MTQTPGENILEADRGYLLGPKDRECSQRAGINERQDLRVGTALSLSCSLCGTAHFSSSTREKEN